MPRPPAVPPDSFVDADVCAQAGSTIERHYAAADLPRLRQAGVDERSQLEVRFRFSMLDARPVVDGTLSGTLLLTCQRCMNAVPVPVEERFKVGLVARECIEEPAGYEPVIADASRLDLRWLAEEQALLALPLVPMHEEPGECRAEEEEVPEQDGQRPFQNLRELLRRD